MGYPSSVGGERDGIAYELFDQRSSQSIAWSQQKHSSPRFCDRKDAALCLSHTGRALDLRADDARHR
jgi:hypothetical protein